MTTNRAPSYTNIKTTNFWSGVLFGLGFIAFVDEVIFHQLLRWHHFYDKTTSDIGLISDGLFHAFSWFATIAGIFLLAHIQRTQSFIFQRWLAGLLVGVGVFQLYDGLIQHKIMRLHQIRYVDNVIVYDIVWNVIAALILVAGVYLTIRTNKEV